MLKRLFRREKDEEKLEQGLEKTRSGLLDRIAGIFGPVDITEDTWDELEAQLIQSDVGVQTSIDVVTALREEARYAGVRRADELPVLLHDVMVRQLTRAARASGDDGVEEMAEAASPEIALVVGVNGSGKTTTIAKIAYLHKEAGDSVLLVAGDTFRAAAIEQLQVWGDRVGVPVAAGQQGGDPGAVVYDALSSSAGQSADSVIIDTAGRLHTQTNLMAELVKVRNVVERVVPGAPHQTLLVLDATTGQNGLLQAQAFTDAVDVTGVVLAKLDSSAKGGVAFAVTRELGLPILYVGLGEGLDDLAPFDAGAYVDGVLGRSPDGDQSAR